MCVKCQENGELSSERKGNLAVHNLHPAATLGHQTPYVAFFDSVVVWGRSGYNTGQKGDFL